MGKSAGRSAAAPPRVETRGYPQGRPGGTESKLIGSLRPAGTAIFLAPGFNPGCGVRSLLAMAILGATLLCGPAAAQDAPFPAGRAADNLTAFARLLAYVRFFHPSDEAAAADWNRVAVAGVPPVEAAPDPETLARTLDGFFRPLAPTVRVYPAGARPELPVALLPVTGGTPRRIVAWRHFGGKFEGTAKSFRSERIDDATRPFGTLLQTLEPGDLRGRRIRLRARVRAELQPEGRFQLGLRVDLPGGRPGFLDNMADRPILTTGWRTVEIEGDVAPDAERIVVLAVLTGEGRVWLDEVSVTPVKGRTALRLANGGFDEGEAGAEPPGWTFPYESIGAGYHLDLRRGAPCLQDGCAEISSDAIATPRFARPDEPLEIDLGGGVSALVPIALWADARGTLPRSPKGAPSPPWAEADPAPDTRDNRIAALLLAWGSLAHFHPTLDLPADEWAAALRTILPEALQATDREEYRRAVLRLLTRLRDPAANDFVHRDDPAPAWLPVEWEWIEDQLVITEVSRGALDVRRGDVVLEVDGKLAAEALAATEALVSAATPEARRALALSYLATGAPGSTTRLLLQHEKAEAPRPEMILARQGRGSTIPDLPPPVTEPSRGVFYVDLRRMDDADLERELPRLAHAKGIVFDLRGWTRVSTILLSHLTGKTVDALTWAVPVFRQPDRQNLLFLHSVNRIEPRAPRLAGKVAFLADARTFQNSERLLETIAAYHWGEIVGARTAGNVGNPNWSDLPGGWTVTWTGRRALKHDGTLLNGVGLQPTVPVARTLRGAVAGRDEVIERGLEIVSR